MPFLNPIHLLVYHARAIVWPRIFSGHGHLRDGFKGNDGDVIVKRIFLLARIDYPQVIEVKVLKSDVHGTAPAGRICVFKLKAVAFAFNQHQQVQLGAGVCCPKIGITGSEGPLRTILGFFLDGTSLVVSAVPAFAAFQAGSAVKFDAGAFGAEPDHRAF